MELPEQDSLAESLFELAEWMRENFEENDVLDPDTSSPGIDVRLQITEEGWQVFHSGENTLETFDDDDGVWTSAWLPYDADEDHCEELAEQMLGELEDALIDEG